MYKVIIHAFLLLLSKFHSYFSKNKATYHQSLRSQNHQSRFLQSSCPIRGPLVGHPIRVKFPSGRMWGYNRFLKYTLKFQYLNIGDLEIQQTIFTTVHQCES